MSGPAANDSPGPRLLAYAPRLARSGHRIRRVAWWTFSAAVVCLCIVLARMGIHQATVLYWQRQCLAYANTGQLINIAAPPGPQPQALTQFGISSGVATRSGNSYCLYLGRMTRPDGIERLVYVYAFRDNTDDPSLQVLRFAYSVVSPATLSDPAKLVGGDVDRFITSWTKADTINTAILDSSDASHFAIAARFHSATSTTIDGFLDNHDTLKIEERRIR